MRTVIRKIPAKTTTSYQCSRCRTKYRSKAKALQCEAQITEEKVFKIGERVTWREPRHCQSYDKSYKLDGKVRKILGPTLPDEEYNFKWLGGRFSGKHIFMYEVSWRCPHCKEIQDGRYYSLELGKIKTR